MRGIKLEAKMVMDDVTTYTSSCVSRIDMPAPEACLRHYDPPDEN